MGRPGRETMTSAFSKRLRVSLAVGAASLCGACSSMENIMPASLNEKPGPVMAAQASHAGDPGTIVRLPLGSKDLDCPSVDVEDAGASMRVGGADNPSVRYQFDITQTVRECAPVPGNTQFSLKVGVSGHLVVGPAGKPGAYTAPLQITVRSESDGKTAYTKTYTVQADTGNSAETVFQFVSDPIILPMTRTELDQDYSVFVAFGNNPPVEVAHPRKRHAAAAAATH